MKTKQRKMNKGFTLIELAVSSAILATIFGAMTLFGVQTIRSHQRSRALKSSIENASYAIEFLNRSIRTSHVVNGDSDKIFIIDNEEVNSYCYFFDTSTHQLKRMVGDSSYANCGELESAGITVETVVGEAGIIVVSGEFDIKETDFSSDQRGFVRTTVGLEYLATQRDNFIDDKVLIQSSVSLRDYGFETGP